MLVVTVDIKEDQNQEPVLTGQMKKMLKPKEKNKSIAKFNLAIGLKNELRWLFTNR